MRKLHKQLALLLALMLCILPLAGCNTEPTPTTQPTASTTQATTAPAETQAPTTEAPVPLTNAERYPLETDTVLRVLYTEDGLGETGASAVWEQATGVHVENLTWNGEQMLTSLATGDIPDAILMPWDLPKELVYEYGTAGKFLDFSQHLDKMPNLSAMIEKYPEILDVCTYPDGAMYSLPKVAWGPTSQGNVLYIRTDILNELGWEKAPATTEEFLQYITAAQEHYADSDEEFVAFHCYNKTYMNWNVTNSLAAFFFPAFGDLIETGLTLDANGTVQLGAATEQYRLYLEYMHNIWNSGAFETEIYTLDSAAGKAVIQGNHCAVSAGTYSREFPSGNQDVTVMEPLTSEYQSEKRWMKVSPITYIGSVANAACEDLDTLLAWLDACYAPESDPLNAAGTLWSCSLSRGEKGVHWDLSDDGMSYTTINGGVTNYYHALGSGDSLYYNKNDEIKGKGTIENVLPYAVSKSGLENLVLSTDDQDTYADIWTDMDSYISEMHGKFISGEEDIAAGWEAYLKNLEKMGLSELLEIFQNAHDLG